MLVNKVDHYPDSKQLIHSAAAPCTMHEAYCRAVTLNTLSFLYLIFPSVLHTLYIATIYDSP